MSHTAVQVGMIVLALAALWQLRSAVTQAHRAGDVDSSTVFIFGFAWLVSLPSAMAAYSGSLTYQPDVFRNLVKTYPAWHTTATHACVGLAAVLAVVLILRRLPAQPLPVHAAALFAVALCVLAHLAGGFHGGSLTTMRGMVLVVCLPAAAILPRGRGACIGAALYGVTLAIAGGVLGLLRYNVAFVVPCKGACSLLGFQGVLPNEDLLGIAMAACIPFVYLGFRGRSRYWLSLYLAGMVAATGSKTSTVAALTAITVLFLVRPRLDATAPTRYAGLAGLMLVVGIAGSVALAQYHWAPQALADRGQLWSVARHYISRSPWIGYGPSTWSQLYHLGVIPLSGQRSAHNQWMDVLFAAGALGVVLLAAMAAAILSSAGRARPAVTIALATILILGAGEGTWQIWTVDSMSFTLLALILTGPAVRRETSPAWQRRSTGYPQRPPRVLASPPVAAATVPDG
ncbi:MAG: O-antigen ligase family protein [Solirubrobacteraceae bacterium]